MKRLIYICIPLLFTLIYLHSNAQQNQRIYYGGKAGVSNAINVFNNKQLTSNLYTGPLAGIYGDFCLHKKLWLFTGVDMTWGFSVIKNRNNGYVIPEYTGYYGGFANLAVAYRITKEDKHWQLYPYAGTSNFLNLAFYKQPLLGFEAKHEYGKRGNIAIGFNSTFFINSFGRAKFNDQLLYLNLYAKIGLGTLLRKKD